jgi:cobalt/nickel transport system permease protein
VLSCLLLVVGIATARVDSPKALAAAGLVSLVLVLWLRPEPRQLLRRALMVLPLLAALVLPLALTGQTERALALTARAVAALVTTLTFAASLDTTELPEALSALGFPRVLVALLASMLRQAGAVASQAQRIVRARRLRGARGSNVSAEVLASLLTKTAERAGRVELSMRLRGVNLDSQRARRQLRSSDAPAIVTAALVAASIAVVGNLL